VAAVGAGAEPGEQVGRPGWDERGWFGHDGQGPAVGGGAQQQRRNDQLARGRWVERERADRGWAQAGAVGVLDLDGVQEGGDRLGGAFDPARAGADRDAGGPPNADQGAPRGAPHEAVLAGQVERVDPVAEVDDRAEQSRDVRPGRGACVGSPGWGGPGVLL
jgi:hypothetical protein